MKLTDAACKAAKSKEKLYKLADGKGMYLKVTPQGSKLWRLKYRFNGKENSLSLGTYPQTSLAEAREQCEAIRKTLKSGLDPSFTRKEEKRLSLQSAGNTFEGVAREWHEKNLHRWTLGHGAGLLNRLEMDIFPHIGKRPVSEIKAPSLLDTLRKIETRGALEIAHRSLQICGRIFRYAIATGRAERDPAADLRGALKPIKRGHYAALEAKDLPAFLHALDRNDARLYAQTRRAVWLIMQTFVRTGELIGAKWDEFDFENAQWDIPAERMKMRKDHIVPLSRQTIAILKEQHELTGKSDWVFPNQARPKSHMSNNTILTALNRLGYKGMHTGHGFRALAMSTIKEKLGYRHKVVDRQLAHAHRNKIDAAYDRAKFLDERKKMMQEWSDYLDAMASNGKVVVGKFGKAL